MNTARCIAVVLLLSSRAAFAQSPAIGVDPPAPTSATAVTFNVSQVVTCGIAPAFAVAGFNITLRFPIDPYFCLGPPILGQWSVAGGLLAPGTYDVLLTDVNQKQYAEASVYVSDADSTVSAHPSTGPATGGTDTLIEVPTVDCTTSTCTVVFDGIPATNIVPAPDLHGVHVSTPPHPAGDAAVVVKNATSTASGRAVFRYYDPSAAPPTTAFERVLIPIEFAGPGAFGSQWVTELAAVNNGPLPLKPYNAITATDCPRMCSGGSIPSITPIHFVFQGGAPSGAFLYVPRDSSGDLHFSARIRDTSRAASSFGTEIPIVREKDLAQPIASGTGLSFEVHLLDVPLDALFRQTLRIYGVSSLTDTAYVEIHSMATGAILATHHVDLTSPTPCPAVGPCASLVPSFGVWNDLASLPALQGTSRVWLRIFSGQQPIWAFVTITNNGTQEVTTVTPR